MSDPAIFTLESSFQLLPTEAVFFSTLSALFGKFSIALNARATNIGAGAYFVLFVIAVWSMYRQSHAPHISHTRLRVITTV